MTSTTSLWFAKMRIQESLNELFLAVLDHKPNDPIKFICERLEGMQGTSHYTPFKHSHQLLKRHHWSDPLFWECMVEVFDELSTRTTRNAGNNTVDAGLFSKLLIYYCCQSEKIRTALLAVVMSWLDYETTVRFKVFSRGVLVFAIFDEFLTRAAKLYIKTEGEKPSLVSKASLQLLFEDISCFKQDIIGDEVHGIRECLYKALFESTSTDLTPKSTKTFYNWTELETFFANKLEAIA